MKKLLLVLLLIPTTISPHYSWPTALSAPLMLPMLTGNKALTEAVADGLNFEHSRGISFELSLPSGNAAAEPDEFGFVEQNRFLNLSYNMRWGYQGAGDISKPFAGIKAQINIELSYEGLSFHLCKSRSLRNNIYKRLQPLLTVAPCEEFYIKLAQLVLSVSQNQSPDLATTRTALETLFTRLRLTPEGTTCKLYGMPILNTPENPGLELFLEQAPDVFTRRFIVISQKLGASMGLITNPDQSAEKQAYLRALIAQVDYFGTKDYRLNLPKGGTISLPFDSVGAGDTTEPLLGTTITIEVPQAQSTPTTTTPSPMLATTSWNIALSPEQECMTRLILLFLHNRKQPLPSYQLTEQISALLTRLSLSPTADGEMSTLRAVLGVVGQYHQAVINYSFDTPLTKTLGTSKLLLQLARVAYKTYTLSSDRAHAPDEALDAQGIANFATKHTAEALRNYQMTRALRHACTYKLRTPFLKKQGVNIDLGLFFSTLFSSEATPEPSDVK